MTARGSLRGFGVIAFVTVALAPLLVGCSPTTGSGQQNGRETPEVVATPSDAWSALLQKTPYPYLLPLPKHQGTVLDGTYAKVESKDSPKVHCLRCADYAMEGGPWKLSLDQGTFRILHGATGWQSVGSFVATRDRWTSGAQDQLLLFNDPACPDAIGLYTWRLDEGNLILEVIDDTCAIYLRAANLTNLAWLSCQPPNLEAGTTDHWLKPAGCD